MPAKLPPVPELNTLHFRKTLSVPALLKKVRHHFSKIKEFRTTSRYSLVDILMSELAIFLLK